MGGMNEAVMEIKRLRQLLQEAAEHTRHPDYEWPVCFEREVWAALDEPSGIDLSDGSGVVVQHANSAR